MDVAHLDISAEYVCNNVVMTILRDSLIGLLRSCDSYDVASRKTEREREVIILLIIIIGER